ncbi:MULTISPECIES: AEC family transporter [unclassified Nitratireductor]|uniref:AEC family transporter n=1 Tax=Nitratireductor TaxID=245876 RepID=UPI000DDFF4FE|nr:MULTISPECIES: AEC family transporter [unclassified Nitratireductor]MCV0349836.1 AEC family transporter [Nitratireductor sp.]
MSPLVETVAFVFGLVAFGYISGWTGLLKTETGEALSEFAVTIAVPLLLFRTMAGAEFGSSIPWALWITYFSAVGVAWVAGHFTIMRFFGRDARVGVVAGLSTSFSNLVLLGIPFMLGVYGQEGFEVLSLIVSIHLPVMLGASILLFSLVGRKGTGAIGIAREFLTKLFSSPLILGIVAGLLWRFSGLEMPALGTRFVDALANVAGPVALFAMGLGLNRFGITGDVRPAIVIAALKLFLMPAVALGVALAVGLPAFSAQVAVVAAALPSGVNPYLIASRFGTGQALASNAMTIGTLFAVFTTAFWLSVVHWTYQ